jgi:hypothetical protein
MGYKCCDTSFLRMLLAALYSSGVTWNVGLFLFESFLKQNGPWEMRQASIWPYPLASVPMT